ncbi:MAG TPA: hypothetical protein PLV45_07905 [bacterium]|nr:hypothetical protein [bacterium]
MKNFNVTLTGELFRELNNRSRVLRFIEQLGHEPALNPWTPPATWPSHNVLYKTPDREDLQVIFAEMDAIYESRLYPMVTYLAENYSPTLMILTADYEYFFFVAIAVTRLPGQVETVLDEIRYPSVQIHRICRTEITPGDLSFIEEWTRTLSRGEDQFRKIQRAFHRVDWEVPGARRLHKISAAHPDDDPSAGESFYELRTELRQHRHLAYSGSRADRQIHLIQPVLEILGYSVAPGRVTEKDLISEPDLFLYRGKSDVRGAVPVAACLVADPLQIPAIRSDDPGARYAILHPNVHAGRLLLNRLYKQVIITDGRLWRILQESGHRIIEWEFDLFQALRLDSSREHTPPVSFLRFIEVTTGPVQTDAPLDTSGDHADPGDPSEIDPRDMIRTARDVLQGIVPDARDCHVAADSVMFQCLVLAYSEAQGFSKPVDAHRWNIPDFRWICTHAGRIADGDLMEWTAAHLKALEEADRLKNIASGMFHDPLEQHPMHTMPRLIQSLSPDAVRRILGAVAPFLSFGTDPTIAISGMDLRDFGRFIARMLHRDSPSLDESLENEIRKRLHQRIRDAVQKSHALADPSRSQITHLRRYLSESFFRFHAVDAHTGCGVRLLDVLDHGPGIPDGHGPVFPVSAASPVAGSQSPYYPGFSPVRVPAGSRAAFRRQAAAAATVPALSLRCPGRR